MTLKFYKYQGTGNDFIIIDNRTEFFSKNNTKLVNFLCDRKFGIGADGLMLVEKPEVEDDDFKMVYYNADGNESSMCGNGGRCLVAFAKHLGIIKDKAKFTAIDGSHKAIIHNGLVSLQMQDVKSIRREGEDLFLDTGSPHHVVFTEEVDTIDVRKQGADIRYNQQYKEKGTNVNFVKQLSANEYKVRTYERGVEDETLSCGTGVTAVAIAASASNRADGELVKLQTPGGELSVSFRRNGETFKEIWLTGPATQVFKGEILCKL